MNRKNSEKRDVSKGLLLILMLALIVIYLFSYICVFAETAQPTEIPTPPTDGGTLTPTGEELVTPSPTATKEPEFLQDFTVPPLQPSEEPSISIAPNETAKPDLPGATIGIVEVDNIETRRSFMWSDFIKYIAYVFFALAGVSIIYGLMCMAALIFFKKDITIAGLYKRKKEKKKKNKK